MEKSIYIIKYDEKSFRQMHESYCKDQEITCRNFANSPEIISFLQNHPEYEINNIGQTCLDAGGIKLVKKIISFTNAGKDNDLRTEAIINKHTVIYSTLSAPEKLSK